MLHNTLTRHVLELRTSLRFQVHLRQIHFCQQITFQGTAFKGHQGSVICPVAVVQPFHIPFHVACALPFLWKEFLGAAANRARGAWCSGWGDTVVVEIVLLHGVIVLVRVRFRWGVHGTPAHSVHHEGRLGTP